MKIFENEFEKKTGGFIQGSPSTTVAKYQYDFIMALLSGNLAEEAELATEIYPEKPKNLISLVSDEKIAQLQQVSFFVFF